MRVPITNRLPQRGEHSALPWQRRLEHETADEYLERLVTALEDRLDDIVRAVNVSDEEIGAGGGGGTTNITLAVPGEPGADGEPGPPGPPGSIGATGAGTPGIQGTIGPPGEDGLDGEAWSIPGPAGAAGANGSQGLSGVSGPPGPAGEDGETGPMGPPGATGATGAPGGGGGSATTVEVDLGATATWRGKFTITDGAITGTSKVLAWQAPGPYTGKGTRADEAEMQPVSVIAVEPAVGSAVVKWETPPMVAYKDFGHGPRAAATGTQAAQGLDIIMAQRINRVRGNVKFTYQVL